MYDMAGLRGTFGEEMLVEETFDVKVPKMLKRTEVRRSPECVSGGGASDAQVKILPMKSNKHRGKSMVLLRVQSLVLTKVVSPSVTTSQNGRITSVS